MSTPLSPSSGLARRTPLKADPEKVREFQQRARHHSKRVPTAISPASTRQRVKVAAMSCVVCGQTPCHPAHLIDRSLCPDGADDPRAVVALCAADHRAYDEGNLSLLEYLEPCYRVELGFAVERFGLLATLRRVTNERGAA